MSVNKYLESANRGDFQWECIETTDGIGFGGVRRESVNLKGRSAMITRCGYNEFEVEIELVNEPFYEFNIRSTRKLARVYAERFIEKDIRISEVEQ
jgi:protein subunit release factor B